MRRIVFLGSMMKTERMVKAIPFASTLVVSWWSSLYKHQPTSPILHTNFGGKGSLHVISKSNLTRLVTNDGERKLAARDLIDILDPSSVRFDCVGG